MLRRLPIVSDPRLLIGVGTSDDAAVFQITPDIALVQSVDFFPPIVDDPYLYGAIAASNSLSDIYAKGGRPILALNLGAFPAGMSKAIVGDILEGGAAKATEAGVLIVGGHTIDDAEPKYGMAVTGLIKPGDQIANSSAQVGDKLILTKSLGTGLITTAAKQDRCPEGLLQMAIEIMVGLNKSASEVMMHEGVNACTDISGFGFLGHLREVVEASGVAARIYNSRVPIMDGVWGLADDGLAPGGTHRNVKSVEPLVSYSSSLPKSARFVLCDPQTSGGLLITSPPEKAEGLLEALHRAGVGEAALIGEVLDGPRGTIEVLP